MQLSIFALHNRIARLVFSVAYEKNASGRAVAENHALINSAFLSIEKIWQKMIQRIQTIYLLLAALALACPIFMPLATASGDVTTLAATAGNYFADGVYWANELPGGMLLFLIPVILVYTIFLYKNRARQMYFAGIMVILTILLSVLLAVFGYYHAQGLLGGAAAHLALGSAFPLIAIPLLLLARRAIKKDEDLVRSSDRLR